MDIPAFLVKFGKQSPDNQAWVDALPSIVEDVKGRWKLEFGKVYTENASCSYVVDCIVDGREQAVLKIGMPHPEALHEIEGLKLLNGKPTVKLSQYDKASNAMLLEKCEPGTSLKTVDEPRQDMIICSLLKEIWQVDYTGENFQPLGQMVRLWNEETEATLDCFPDPYLARQGCQLKQELIESTKKSVLLATDLHAGNVLRAKRKPWLAIDIKPHTGDAAYDLTQHLLNCPQRLQEKPLETINRLANLAQVNRSRLKDWLFARLAAESDGLNQKLTLCLR